jgi:hypothetical protein
MTEKSQQDDLESRAEEWWEGYKEKNPPHGQAKFYYADNRHYALEGYRAGEHVGARAERERLAKSPDGVLALAIEQDLGVYSYGGLGPIHREAITERNARMQELIAENARLTERLRIEEQAHREMRAALEEVWHHGVCAGELKDRVGKALGRE